MRGNWETTEAMIVTPNHREQTNILEERHPLHLSSPPVWGIVDQTVVKEEPMDDKASDSGVSPDHYSCSTSSQSRRSSTVNCSLSPGSSTSQDSNVLPCTSYNQYSSESAIQNDDLPMDFSKSNLIESESFNNNNNNKHRQSPDEHQKMDVTSDETKSGGEEPEVDLDTFRCPLANCTFTTRNRAQFSEHLANHYSANEMPDFTKLVKQNGKYSNSPQLSPVGSETNRASSSQGERFDLAEQEFEGTEEPGIRVPRVNSQGKIKTFRCKQCNYTSITKLQFWDHSRGHIKVEKLLTCPKCPFVTEYKHHLEYHLRNHFGSKPFKCDKCPYSCVNKSMLNSHLKSHSNVYQYRCANCSYATKYLHSLKLHLRKYNHQPAMVLNADGTPNPLPIVDVYGTRRGPKQKNLTPKLSDETPTTSSGNPTPRNKQRKQNVTPPPISPTMNPMNASTSYASGNGINSLMALQYSQLYNVKYPIANPFGISNEVTEKQIEQIRQSFCAEYAKAIVNEKMNAELSQDGSPFANLFSFKDNASTSTGLLTTTATVHASNDMISSPITPDMIPDGKITPLDLSKPDTGSNDNNDKNNIQDYHSENCQKKMTVTTSKSTSQKASGTSRRKGKAFKLAVRENENKYEEEDHSNVLLRQSTSYSIPKPEELKESADKNTNSLGTVSNNDFFCQYCEIAFGNEVMYTVHMGYHGYKNPFTCNMCGHQCDDKVSFFLHIARSKHG